MRQDASTQNQRARRVESCVKDSTLRQVTGKALCESESGWFPCAAFWRSTGKKSRFSGAPRGAGCLVVLFAMRQLGPQRKSDADELVERVFVTGADDCRA